MEWVASDIGLQSRDRWLFRHVSADAADGELVSVVGDPDPDRGMLTLALSGRLKLREGGVMFDGEALGSGRASHRAAVGWLPGMRLFEDRARCAEIIEQAYRISHTPKAERDAAALLATAGLADAATSTAEDLRAIEKAALGVAMVRALRPRIAFIDVPPAAEAARTGIRDSIAALIADGTAVVVVHHKEWPGSVRSIRLDQVPQDEETDAA